LNNEKGFALPLMIAITFITAYLLLMLAKQLEIKVASYDRTRNYMAMNLLESKGLQHPLREENIESSFSTIQRLRKNVKKTENATKLEDFFAFHYKIVYNDNIHLQKEIFYLE